MVAAVLVAGKASGLRGAPFEPEKQVMAHHIWLQATSHMVTGSITYGYRLHHIWLQAVPRLLELLGLPASLGGTVKLRAREVSTSL